MSWNSGGPWGNGPGNGNANDKNQGAKKPGQSPGEAEMDEWLRKSQERLRQVFPPKGNSGGGGSSIPRRPKDIWGIIILAAAILWLASGFYQVSTNQVGVVLRFGKAVRSEQPGLHYHLPMPVEHVFLADFTNEKKIEIGFRSVNGQNHSMDVEDESRMLTGDENIVDLDFIVNWRIKNAQDFLFNVRSPELTIKMAAESGIREVIGRMKIQDVLTEKRLEIETNTRELIQDMLDEYKAGITITRVQLLDVSPPPEVKDAFDDVTRARADGDRARNEAESYRNGILPQARGEAEKAILDAEGYKASVVGIAKGDAARFESVLKAYEAARDVTATKLYLETMVAVLKDARKIIIDPAASKNGTVPYLPLGEMIRKTGPSSTPAPASTETNQ